MQKFGNLCLKLIGWKIEGDLPKDKKYVVVVAPHTSNWDFILGLLARFSLGVKIHFLAKTQLFFFPLGTFLKAVGGAPVDRSKKNNNVDRVVDLFRSKDEFRLAITPEGTRSPVTRWKEGFYHIAYKAEIPIAMVGLDYTNKVIRIREPFYPSGDINKDFPIILDYYKKINGCYPKEIPEYVPHKKESAS
ncbi:MAG: lysophospholipid acyltransferase family protein [Legionella sp.]|nr:lysophospholipid acyltransferase family protein [Legionella sp.]